MPPKPTFFLTPADFRGWFEANHDKSRELLVGFYKKDSGKPSITWPESVQVALCFGWIDGVRKSIDETSYMIRFTPRKPTSNWSSININLVRELTMQPNSLVNKRNNFAPTKQPGNSSVPKPRGTKG
jgi:uncharacterized protein YdeI (YjbR/CyaY-like superfamily)